MIASVIATSGLLVLVGCSIQSADNAPKVSGTQVTLSNTVTTRPVVKPVVHTASTTTTQDTSIQVRNNQLIALTTQKPALLQLGDKGANVLQLQVWLATTGYLPLNYMVSGTSTADPTKSSNTTSTALPAKWSWRYKNVPTSLQKLWNPNQYTLLTQSAVMTFQQVHGLAVDGIVGPHVLAALRRDVAQHRLSPDGFSVVEVSLHQPQRLQLWHNGKIVVSTLVNGGIASSKTVTGTYPIYLQYRTQTMSGTDPWGNHYSDPGIPYVSYFYKGEAIHGFVRSQYGYPQSLGCVELPIAAAKRVWPNVHLGTLVQVSNASDSQR